jgi:hypothetical protein
MKKIFLFIFVLSFALTISVHATEDVRQEVKKLETALSLILNSLGLENVGGGVDRIPSVFRFTENLRQGARGTGVKYLQILLNSDPDTRVALAGSGSSNNETEFFGPATTSAVIRFQNKYRSEILTPSGLSSGTGFVGESTRKKLNEILTKTAPPPVEPPEDNSDIMAALKKIQDAIDDIYKRLDNLDKDKNECKSDNDCDWCSAECVLKGSASMCRDIALDRNYECLCENGECLIKGSTWVEIEPTQCGGNPWGGISQNHYLPYKDSGPALSDAGNQVIKGYYENSVGVRVFEISSLWHGDALMCEACHCSDGTIVYLRIEESDLARMERDGFKIVTPKLDSKNCKEETYEQTCQEKCNDLGYGYGICKSFGIHPAGFKEKDNFEKNYYNAGETKDCYVRQCPSPVLGVDTSCYCYPLDSIH